MLADLPALRVLGAPLDQAFLMKLPATRVRSADVDDMVALWPRTGFASGAQAVALYYEAYPLAEQDPFLAAYVADLTGARARRVRVQLILAAGDAPCRRTVRLPFSEADGEGCSTVLPGRSGSTPSLSAADVGCSPHIRTGRAPPRGPPPARR